MKEELMQRLLSLVEKTGDKMVITDPAGDHPYVLMGLGQYEKLVVGEWKPETVKHAVAPPGALPLSTGIPDNKPPKKEIPLWKSPKMPARPAPMIRPPSSPQPAAEVALEAEGEEQFYLEALE